MDKGAQPHGMTGEAVVANRRGLIDRLRATGWQLQPPPYVPLWSHYTPITTLSGDTTTNWCRMVVGSFSLTRGVKEIQTARKNILQNKTKHLFMLAASKNTVRCCFLENQCNASN